MARTARGVGTKERLLDVAIERLAAAGGSAVNFDAIAADAGLTKGALYHYFDSTEDLVEAVYKESIRRHSSLVIAASSAGTGRERLHRLIEESAALYGSETSFYRLLLRLHVEAGATRPHLAPIARVVQRRQREYMTELVEIGQADGSIRADVDSLAVGRLVNATLQGLLVQQLEPAAEQRRAALEFAHLIETLL